MILYFSGTGNSAYAAKRLGEELRDETLDLFARIRGGDFSEIESARPWVVVCPTYAWRMPRVLLEWIEKTAFRGCNRIYFVLTCGGNIGNAGAYAAKLCAAKGWKFAGCAELVMPENYIALFAAPPREEARGIIEKAEEKIRAIAAAVGNGEDLPPRPVSLIDKLSSGIVNVLFYPLFVHAKKFRATDACVACRLCERLCPLRNIRLVDGRPVWSDNCTHCMACINRCPREAIEYGMHTVGLARYTCPKK